MKKFLSLLVGVVMILVLVACGGSKEAPEQTTQTDGETVLIGGLAPLTGNVSQYGIATNNGIKLAVDEINAAGGVLGKQIEYIVEDEQGDQEEAVNAYTKLVHQDGVVAIVGDVTTKPTMAVANVAARDNVPMITATATGEAVTQYGENVFRACFIDPYQGELMAHYAADRLGAKKVAIIFDNGDDYSSGVAEAFKNTAEELELEVVYYEGYTSGIDDFSAQIARIKEQDPDVVMSPSYYEDVSNIISEARGVGLDVTFLGSDGWDGVQHQIDPGKYDVLENAYYCSQYSRQSTDPKVQAFITTYQETYNMEENMFAVLGYDAMHMMAAAINEAGSVDPDAIAEAMKNLNHEGLTGTTTFDENRNPVREAYITEFVDGEPVVKETYSFN